MGEIAKKIAGLSPAAKRAYLCNLDKLLTTGHLEKYYQHLMDFDFMSAKISHSDFSVQALIEDYDLIDSVEGLNYADHSEKIRMLKLIQGALRLSAHILVKDPTQFASQLWGRLQNFDMPELQSLLQQAKQNQTVWLCPLKSSLIPPDGRLLRVLTGYQDSVNTLAVSSNGNQVVSGSDDGTLRVWDLAKGKAVVTLSGHHAPVNAVTVSLDGKQVVSGSKDGTFKVWDLTKEQKLLTLAQNQFPVKTFAVSSSRKWVISVNLFEIKKWNLETRKSKVLLSLKDMREIVLEEEAKKWWEFWKEDLIDVDISINTITLTPDGKIAILDLSIDKTVIARLPTLTGSTIPVGHNVIRNTTLWIRNLETGEGFNIDRSQQNRSHTTAIAVTPDGIQAICGMQDGHIEVWNLETRQQRFTLWGHSDEIVAVTIASNSKQAVSSSKDKTLKIWDIETGREIYTLTGFSDLVTSIVITPNCKQLISGSRDTMLKIWSLEEGYHLSDTFNSKKVSSHIYLGLTDYIIRIFSSILTLFLFAFFEGYPFLSSFLYFSQNTIYSNLISSLLFIVCEIVYITILISVITRFNQTPNFLKAFSFLWLIPTTLVSKIIKTNKIVVNECHNQKANVSPIVTLAVTTDNKWIVSGSNDKNIKFWNLETGKQLFMLTGHRDQISSVAASPNSKYVISSSVDKTIKVWNREILNKVFHLKSWSGIAYDTLFLSTYAILTVLELSIIINLDFSHPFFLFSLLLLLLSYPYYLIVSLEDEVYLDWGGTIIVTSDSKKVIFGSKDKTIKVWDIETRRQLFTLKGHTDWITSVAVTLNGKRLISGSKDKTLKVWNLEMREELFTLTGHSSKVNTVTVIPDGSKAISGSSDGQLKIWDLESREAIVNINGHRDAVEAIALIDGKYFVSAAADRMLKVWDLLTGREITRFTADSPLTSCVVASEGRIIAGDQAGQLHFLRLENI